METNDCSRNALPSVPEEDVEIGTDELIEENHYTGSFQEELHKKKSDVIFTDDNILTTIVDAEPLPRRSSYSTGQLVTLTHFATKVVTDFPSRLDPGHFEQDRYWERGNIYDYDCKEKRTCLRPSCVPISAILLLIVLVVLWPLLSQNKESVPVSNIEQSPIWANCKESCGATIVESIPEGMSYPNSTTRTSTFDGWKHLIKFAEKTIDIVAFYWTLRGSDVIPDPSDWQGEAIFKLLLEAGRDRSIAIRIVQNEPSHYQPSFDSDELREKASAVVRNLNMQKLIGAGILHTKLWIIDGSHFYIGSANMDWRALTQVKELGVIFYNCSCIVEDLAKIFEVYWMMAQPDATIPSKWPQSLETKYNLNHPMEVVVNQSSAQIALVSSPPDFCPYGRSSDLEGVLEVMNKAEHYIYVAVMDYSPTSLYTLETEFWPIIDDALRSHAIERKVEVRLLISNWTHTRADSFNFLHSLEALNGALPNVSLQVKLFVVPPLSGKKPDIPYTRVNHNKYMVTDNAAFIGTSNWSKDYFIWTGGVSVIVNQCMFHGQLRDIFLRDWESEYAISLSSTTV